jgi:hypothetical protein
MSETSKNASFTKSSRWLLLWTLATGLVLLLIAFMPMRDATWEGMRARLAERQEEARSRKIPRAVLSGRPIPGNAWDDYTIVLNDSLTWKPDPSLSWGFAEGTATPADRQVILKLIMDHGAMLDHLHRGAQREDGQYPFKWEQGVRMAMPNFLQNRAVANFAAARAKALLDDGRAEEAVNLLLDLSVFARDSSGNAPYVFGHTSYRAAFDGLRNVVLSGKLSSEKLKDLAEKLERVDHDMPALGAAFDNERLIYGSIALELGSENMFGTEWMGMMRQGGWRYGLSGRRLAVDMFYTMESFGERLRKLDTMDFKDAIKEANAIHTEAFASANPLVRQGAPEPAPAVMGHRELIAKLRLLRAAATLKATGNMPRLADPFGGDLLMSKSGGRIKLWSLGTDGADQGGVGSWNTDSSGGATGDLVFEFPR